MATNFKALLSTCAAMAFAASAQAQTAAQTPTVAQNGTASGQQAQDESADIVVTAQKRQERVLDVPISVSVVNPAQLDRQNIQSINELQRAVPSLTVNGGGQIAIRGVQTNGVNRSSEPAATVVVDGVVLGRAQIQGLFDVARVEVLSGPQGMLFGKNASAGVVNIVTASPNPSKSELIAHADVGDYNFHRERITANVPLADNAAVRFSAFNSFADTPVRTTVRGGQRNYNYLNGIRGRFLWEPTSALSFNIIGDYEHFNTSGQPGAVFGVVDPTTPLATAVRACGVTVGYKNLLNCSRAQSQIPPSISRYGVSGQADLRLGDYTLTSITANRWFDQGNFGYFGQSPDSDLLPANILDTNSSSTAYKTFSQELRLASPSGRTVEFVAGLFYSKTSSRDQVAQAGGLGTLTLPGLGTLPSFLVANLLTTGSPAGPFNANTQFGRVSNAYSDNRSLAAFGQATIHVTDRLGLIAGARYTDEKLDANLTRFTPAQLATVGFAYFPVFAAAAPLTQTVNTNNFSFRAGAQYEITSAVNVYATATRGFKGPAVNDQGTVPAGVSPIVKAEIPMYYEAGLKGALFNGRLLGTIALFHNKVKNFQTAVYAPPSADVPVGGFFQGNAPYIVSKGVEVALTGKVSREFTLNAGVIYNDSKYAPSFVVACGTQQTAGVGSCSTAGTTAPTNRLAGTPLWRVVVSGEYARKFSDDFTGFLQSDIVHESSYDFSSTPDPITRRPSTERLGARIGIRNDRTGWGISVFGRNLLDQYRPAIQPDPLGGFNGGRGRSYYFLPTLDDVRTYGLTLDLKFGNTR